MSRELNSQKQPKNPLLVPFVGKVVINMSVGQSGESLQRAMRVLGDLTGQKPCTRRSKKTIREFGIRQGEPISCICTLRGEKAMNFLKKALDTVDNKLKSSSFDTYGNFSFGIKEHIEMPGVKYVPELGIFGMDVCVSVEKPGYRVKRRRIARSKIGITQKLTPEESMGYIGSVFGVEFVGGQTID